MKDLILLFVIILFNLFSLEVIDIQSSVKQSVKNTYLLKKKNASLIIHVIDLGYHCYGALFKTRFKEKLFITPIS